MFTIIGADGKEYGPVTADNIRDWITAGRANLQTKARRDGDTEWKALADFPEFSSTPAPAVPPLTSAPVAAPAFAAPVATSTLVLANRWLRLAAQLIDGLIGGLLMIPGFVIMISAGIFSQPENPNAALLAIGFAVIGVAFLILLAVQIYLLTTRGQTIGKKILGIRIVDFETETNAGFVKAVLLRIIVNGVIGCVPFIGPIYSLVDICFIFRDDQRCVHDLIAGTKVVVA